jgi:MFS family permease
MKQSSLKARALQFVLLIGVMSFFADFTYEGSRSIIGPYLAVLGASAAVVGIVTGFGELLGYGLRLVSGRLSDQTGQYWPITIFGYIIQMLAVPLLALAGNWPVAALLIILERVGKATRNPPRDVMLSHAAREMGYGWAFGVHEALDQAGALVGPLVVAGVLALRGEYQIAFAVLLVPAIATLSILLVARLTYPRPQEMEVTPPDVRTTGLPRIFWIYLAGAVLVAAGFADFPLIAFRFAQASTVSSALIPVFYAVAMGMGGIGSLAFGRLFDRFGISVLIPLTVLSALFAPLVFLGGFWAAFIGVVLWGLGIGVHESIIPAAVAPMVPIQRRASAYGLFTAGYGIFWFLGSAFIGILYGVSLPALIAFSLVAELAAIPLFILVSRMPVQ